MATTLSPVPTSNTVRVGVDIPSITTTTKTEFVGFDGKIIKSTLDVNGKPHRIHKVITTTTTVTCFGEDDLDANKNHTAEEKFVEHAKELGADTKDVLLHTAVNLQHALETAGDYIRTQLSTTSGENTDKPTGQDQTSLLQQASALKDVIVQKAIDVKDATVDVIKDLSTPQDQVRTAEFHQGTTTLVAEKKNT